MGLRLGLLSALWVRRKVNGLGSVLGLWSGLRVRRMVNALGVRIGASLMVWA